jgi:hypothetical protein
MVLWYCGIVCIKPINAIIYISIMVLCMYVVPPVLGRSPRCRGICMYVCMYMYMYMYIYMYMYVYVVVYVVVYAVVPPVLGRSPLGRRS